LELRGLRCWRELSFSATPDINLLIGDNGVGKTTLLEAVYLVTQLRPPGSLRWRELIPQGADSGFLSGTIAGAHGEHHVRIGFDRSERRLRVDDAAPSSAAAFAAEFPVVFFRPGDLSLVQGGPRGRRQLLDHVAGTLFADHRELCGRYAQALAARNALLKAGGELLEVWSQEAARYGAAVMGRRAEASEALASPLAEAYGDLAGDAERLRARYKPCVPLKSGAEGLIKLWAGQRDRDRRHGHTGQGPHSEDWGLRLDDRNLRQRASQGQQRSAVLACRLAQVALIAERRHPPILLLDDIAGELDDRRTERLFEQLLARSGQVFVTATRDASPWLGGNRDLTRFEVKRGEISII